jgi:hypothetical protein
MLVQMQLIDYCVVLVTESSSTDTQMTAALLKEMESTIVSCDTTTEVNLYICCYMNTNQFIGGQHSPLQGSCCNVCE